MKTKNSKTSRGIESLLGKFVWVKTVLPYYWGRLVEVTATHYVLDDATWTVDNKRESEFLLDPVSGLTEGEFVGTVLVERSGCLAVFPGSKQAKLESR
jgi:hypothetical protein